MNTNKQLQKYKVQDVEKEALRPYIKEVIEHFLPLKRDGSNYKTCCPFHDEKTPSFNVVQNATENYFKCFGCGVGGDVITFVQKYKNLNFLDAVREIQSILNIDATTTKIKQPRPQKPQPQPQQQKEFSKPKKEQYTISNTVIEYFKGRGISQRTLEIFNVKESLHYFHSLNTKTISIDFNCYRNKELINIKHRSIIEKVEIIDGEIKRTKYFLMEKNCEKIFWNLDNIEQDAKEIYITEGEIDALTLGELLYTNKNIVSVPNGANISFLNTETEKLLKNKTLILFLDDDKAGIELKNAFLRKFKDNCLIAKYPNGCKDINEVLKDFGRSEGLEVIQNIYNEQAKLITKKKIETQTFFTPGTAKKLTKKQAKKEYRRKKIQFVKECKQAKRNAKKYKDLQDNYTKTEKANVFKNKKGTIPILDFSDAQIFINVGYKYTYTEITKKSYNFQHNLKNVIELYRNKNLNLDCLIGKDAHKKESTTLLLDNINLLDVTKEMYFKFVSRLIAKMLFLENTKEQIFKELEINLITNAYKYVELDTETGEIIYKRFEYEDLGTCWDLMLTQKQYKPKAKCLVFNPKKPCNSYFKAVQQAKALKKLNTTLIQKELNTSVKNTTLKEVAEKLNMHVNTVKNRVKELGISTVKNRKELIQDLKNTYPGVTQKEVSERLNISIRTVKNNWN